MEIVGVMVGMDKEKINVYVIMLGGVFGCKFKFDFLVEVVFLLMKMGKLICV